MIALILITALVTGILKSGTSAQPGDTDRAGVPDSIVTVEPVDTLPTDTVATPMPKKSKKKNKDKRRKEQPVYRNPLDEKIN